MESKKGYIKSIRNTYKWVIYGIWFYRIDIIYGIIIMSIFILGLLYNIHPIAYIVLVIFISMFMIFNT
jgi:hypothetical protein